MAVAPSLLKGAVRFALLLWVRVVGLALSNFVQDDLTPTEGIVFALAVNQQRMDLLGDGELDQ